MKKKLTLAVATMLAAGFLLTACGSAPGGDTPATPPTTDEPTNGQAGGKIALMMSHMTNSFVTTVADAAKQKGGELGYEVVVFDGKQDASTQVGQIEQAVAQGFRGILVEPVSADGVVPGLIAANDAGVPIATLVQRASQQDLAATYIGGDEVNAGRLQMTEAIKAIGGSGSIGVIYGPMGSEAMLTRQKGYNAVLAENPDVNVAFEGTGNWVTAEGLEWVENWLSPGTELKGIVSQNDGMAVGAVQAIENAGQKGKVMVFGIDATEDGIAAIKDGGMLGTVSQDTPGIGRLGVETMDKMIQGETVPPEVLTVAQWITAGNADTVG